MTVSSTKEELDRGTSNPVLQQTKVQAPSTTTTRCIRVIWPRIALTRHTRNSSPSQKHDNEPADGSSYHHRAHEHLNERESVPSELRVLALGCGCLRLSSTFLVKSGCNDRTWEGERSGGINDNRMRRDGDRVSETN